MNDFSQGSPEPSPPLEIDDPFQCAKDAAKTVQPADPEQLKQDARSAMGDAEGGSLPPG